MSDELEKKEPGLEERFAKIDAILDAMEDENVTLLLRGLRGSP